jgi:hypothetical protein
LKKRTKRLLIITRYRCRTARTNEQKFFGSFFQKRTAFFLPFRAPQAEGHESFNAPANHVTRARGVN